MFKIDKPRFLIEINSLLSTKYLKKNAVDTMIIKGIISFIKNGVKSPPSINLVLIFFSEVLIHLLIFFLSIDCFLGIGLNNNTEDS